MSRSIRRAGAATAVLCSLGVTGVLVGVTVASVSGSAPPASPASTEDAATSTDNAEFSASTGDAEFTASTDDAEFSVSTGDAEFADGEEARAAAEELLATYIESEYGASVTDVACSVPDSGAVGARFACYALKPDDLVIALRATVGPQRLVALELLLDEQTTTTTTTTTPPPSTSSPP